MNKTPFFFSLALLCLLPALTACGVKPRSPDAPPHVTQDRFPQVYPPAETPDARYVPDNYAPPPMTPPPSQSIRRRIDEGLSQ